MHRSSLSGIRTLPSTGFRSPTEPSATAHAAGRRLVLEPGRRYIVDVGSIGQPRDLNPRASFVFYDPQSRKVEWVRYPYPIREVQDKIHEAHLPEYLAMRLESGR